MIKMTKSEIYFTFFPEWFESYCHKRKIDSFQAGKNCVLVMNLMYNPFYAVGGERDERWEGICAYYLGINGCDDSAREALVESVISYAKQHYKLKEYICAKEVDGVETEVVIYHTEQEINDYDTI
jgi:hypothetical protein